MTEEFYVIKLGDGSYWLRDFGSRHLISGSAGSPIQATHIDSISAAKVLPELRKICPCAALTKVTVNYAEESCV